MEETEDQTLPSLKLAVQPPIEPMLAQLTRHMASGGGWLYEPNWDGFRALAEQTPASFVAFDVLVDAREDLRSAPSERRARLEQLIGDAKRPVYVTPGTTDRELANRWFERFEGCGLDGVVAKCLDGSYEPGKRTMLKVKHSTFGLDRGPGGPRRANEMDWEPLRPELVCGARV